MRGPLACRLGTRGSLAALVGIVLGLNTLFGHAVVVAHHAFSSEFDAGRAVTLTGMVNKVEWTNPHAWIHLDVRRTNATTENWAIETATPSTLLRRGLRKKDLVAGAVVKIDGYQARDSSLRAHGTYITLADGRRVFLSSPLADFGDDQR